MLRRYSNEQVKEKLGLDEAELSFLLHQFRELLSDRELHIKTFSDKDVAVLGRAYHLLSESGKNPADIRVALQGELSGVKLSGRRQVASLAFCSGRSAVGKSSLVFNIATALAAQGARCAIFDGSIGNVNLAVASPSDDHDWISLLDSGVHIIYGEKFLNSETNQTEAQASDREDKLNEINSATDFILVDVGPGRPDTVLRYAMVVAETVLVTTPDMESNTDCFSAIRMLRDVNPTLEISVIINRASSLSEARDSFARINGAAGKLDIGEINALGWVAEDDAMRAWPVAGRTAYSALPTSISARCIARIADHLIHRLTPVKQASSGGLNALVGALRNAVNRENPAPEHV